VLPLNSIAESHLYPGQAASDSDVNEMRPMGTSTNVAASGAGQPAFGIGTETTGSSGATDASFAASAPPAAVAVPGGSAGTEGVVWSREGINAVPPSRTGYVPVSAVSL
jgi:hypothetical protein